MLYFFILIFASLLLVLCLPVYFIISYNNGASVYFRFLFVKKEIPLDVNIDKGNLLSNFDELSRAKDKIFDIYSKLNGKIKISTLKIHALVDMSDALLFPVIFGASNAALGAFLGALDSHIGIDKKRADVWVKCANLDTPATIFAKIVLKASFFHFLVASTYALLRALFNGGKNGRKQAK